MILKSLTLQNFKAIGEEPVRIDFKPITLLFGPNSGGKSTVIQALHYLREIFETKNVNPDRTLIGGKAIDLGGFEKIVHRQDLKRAVRLRVDIDFKSAGLDHFLASPKQPLGDAISEAGHADHAEDGWIQIEIRWSESLGQPFISEYEVGFQNRKLATISDSGDGTQVQISFFNYNDPMFRTVYSMGQPSENEANPVRANLERMIRKEYLPSDSEASIGLWWLDTAVPNFDEPLRLDENVWLDDSESGVEKCGYWGVDIERELSLCGSIREELEASHSPLAEFFEYFSSGDVERDAVTSMLSTLIVGPGTLVRDQLRRMSYLGPIREIPNRDFKVPLSPDPTRFATGLGAWDLLYESDDSFLCEVNKWLASPERLHTGYEIEMKAYREVSAVGLLEEDFQNGLPVDSQELIRDQWEKLPIKKQLLLRELHSGLEVQPQDIGVGISQLIPVVVAALQFESGILAIEQPELHIHPAQQVALGDLFISLFAKSPFGLYLLETHSEHLMLRILRRIRETAEGKVPQGNPELKPDDISVIYIDRGPHGLTAKQLRVDETGEFIDPWPRGFFDERFRELY